MTYSLHDIQLALHTACITYSLHCMQLEGVKVVYSYLSLFLLSVLNFNVLLVPSVKGCQQCMMLTMREECCATHASKQANLQTDA